MKTVKSGEQKAAKIAKKMALASLVDSGGEIHFANFAIFCSKPEVVSVVHQGALSCETQRVTHPVFC